MLTAVCHVEPNVPDFFLDGLLTENLLYSHGFYQKFIFALNIVNFYM